MSSVLSVAGLKRSFTQGHKTLEILRGIDLDVQPGELIGLVGVSGSGKSTLLQAIGLLDRQDAGEIEIDGQATFGASDDERTRVRREKLGFIYQFHHLLPDFSTLENVSLAHRIEGKSSSKATAETKELLVQLGLADRLDHMPSALSGGEQQRVAIARALAGPPKLVLADEPTGNLDEQTAGRVFDLFVKTVREKGVAAIIATHDKSLAAQTDRQYQLKDGLLSLI
ncbi:MAG: ABC transporter ATP-binding protein [Kordiimonadaceae bacterium]|nr:ABC transporter ATP-binding protein [Kordiimonadaceae bacterium]MBO6570339.1 ABC transporter ATP-binding protein [Kordiimonadaceae bacterium]MBO6965563.1 ABC transporter ATP-binding protein [Kordiimonadaceae bacterium]